MLLNIGFGNMVVPARVVAVISSDSSPMKRYRDEARERGLLVDATQGRKTRSVLVMDSGHVLLSAIAVDTIAQRWGAGPGRAGEER